MDSPIKKAASIRGLTTEVQLKWLYEAAQRMESIVEIGSHRGRSTYVLCSGCRGKVYAVDPFEWDPWHCGNVFDDFMRNLRTFHNLSVLIMTSEEAAASVWVPPSVDMVFIDADHSYEAVLADLRFWEPRVKKMICGHDIKMPGVKQAVEDFLGADVCNQDDIWWREKNA
ncbi:MAG: class I SAM-dependent methyltransferase [Deltaproteobacteria bacterium]|nr:MAG: class I SAM-dependent methyltransferase [Deltaproteobacteria bacterium]